MKLAPLSAVLLSQFVSADAGNAESQHDARLCALYGAFMCVFKDGNKTQVELVKAAASTYTKAEDCGVLVGTPGKAGAAAKRAFKIYQAYAHGITAAFDDVAPCALLKIEGKKASIEQCAEYAERAAYIVGDLVLSAITPKEKTEAEKKAAEEKAATKKAEKEKEEKAAAKAAAAERKTEIEKAAARKLASDAEAVIDATVNMLAVGALDAEQIAMLAEAVAAAQARAVVATAAAPVAEEATEAA
jgi:hypothetical protein